MQYLSRFLENEILIASQYFKVILLLGARQVGKSTLLAHLFPQIKTIVFDPIQDLYNARKDPDLFLDSFPAPLILDEVQFAPELLAALKRRVDRSEKNGQYFLTGSQNFSVLKTVSESMAGRVAVFHLENLTLQEIMGKGLEESWLTAYLQNPLSFSQGKKTASTASSDFYSLVEFLYRGSFPGTLSLPTAQMARYFQSYLHTYVDRDIRIQEDIRQLAEFDRFLGLCASLTAQEINFSQLGRDIGVSPNTAHRWLDLLKASYQWIELLPFHGNTIKRLSGKKKGYFKDTGFACYLQRIDSPEALAINPKLGAMFETWVINHIIALGSATPTAPNLYHWRTAGGAQVDLILEKNGKVYPIEIKCKSNLSKADLNGLKAFRATYEHLDVMPGIIIYAGSEIFKLDEHTTALPWNLL